MSVKLIDWRDKDNLVDNFTKAFTEIGFARLYNIWDKEEEKHIIDWYNAVKIWFLTANDKDNYKADKNAKCGYTTLETQLLNPNRKKDFKENFEIDVFDDLSYLPPILLKQFIISFPYFQNKSFEIISIFEKVLKVESGFLLNKHIDPNLHHFRTAYYPASEERDNQLPCSEHKDYNTFSLIFSPDKNKRLQVKDKQGDWHDIEYLDNAVTINVGNLMQVWTHGYLTSAFHRVLYNNQPSFTSAYFLNLSNDVVLDHIGPNQRKYDKMTVGSFNKQFHAQKQIFFAKNAKNK